MTADTVLVALLSLVAVSSALPSDGKIKPFECTQVGRFPVEEDCSLYHICQLQSDGTIAHSKGDCKGYAFHPDLKACVDPSKVPNCNHRKPRQLPPGAPAPGVTCTGDSYVCGDCKTVVSCIGSSGYIEMTCPTDSVCQESDGTAICSPNSRTSAQDCTCTADDADATKADPYTQTNFLYCLEEGADPVTAQCPIGLQYDADKGSCLGDDGASPCQTDGTFGLPDCSGTYTCRSTSRGWLKTSTACPVGTLVRTGQNNCTDPCTWTPVPHVCSAVGRFRDPTNCNNYVVCMDDPVNVGTFLMIVRQCAVGNRWDYINNKCAMASDVPCESMQPHNCVMPSCPAPVFRSDNEAVHDVIGILQTFDY